MIIHDHEQQSPEWWQARLGIPTASGVDKILTSQGKPSKQADAYMHTLIAESLSGRSDESFSSFWTERGKEVEAEALDMLALVLDTEIETVGFITDDARTIGASPDGLIGGGEAGVEIKCPKGSTHIKYLLAGRLPTEYICQVQTGLYVTGAKHWWFASYYPGLSPLIVKVLPNNDWHNALAVELKKFHSNMTAAIGKLKEAA